MKKLLPFCFLLFLVSCTTEKSPQLPERGLSPWVFRSVLDQRARMLTAALHEDLFVAYSAETGALYKAWKGDVKLDGAVYTTAHGPQPEAVGKVWLKDTMERHWFYQTPGSAPVYPEVRYLGHRIKDGQLYLKTSLTDPTGKFTAIVSERPEAIQKPGGMISLERTFFVEGLPPGVDLNLRLLVDGIPSENSLQTDGTIEVINRKVSSYSGLRSLTLYGVLKLKSSGTTYLHTNFIRYPTLPDDYFADGGLLADNRGEGEKLIERNGCKTCHNTVVKTVGPAYLSIAERYPNNTVNLEKLTSKVIKGGSGTWGKAAMTPHDHLPPADIRTMVQWVLDLDKEKESSFTEEDPAVLFSSSEADALPATGPVTTDGLGAGVRAEIFPVPDDIVRLNQAPWQSTPIHEGIAPTIDFVESEWGKLSDLFAARFTGYLKIPQTSNYLFRLRSDDGSRLLIDGQEIINNDGLHGPDPRDGEIALAAGNHPLLVEYFERGGGNVLTLEWRSFFNPEWQIVPTENLGYDLAATDATSLPAPMDRGTIYPGDGIRLTDVHPSYDLRQARPDGFTPKVGGMDFLSDGRLVVSTWDAEGAVYLIEGAQTGDPQQMTTKKIASGLAEPLGLKVVDDTIFVMQKQELTKLIDHNGDELIDEYVTVSNKWKTTANFHEFGFGLAYEAPYFYATLAIGILPGGASAPNQPRSRGKCVRIHRQTGALDVIASGLRTPNGINFGVDGELFIADNQGDWLPASKILHVSEGAFFNSYAVPGEEGKTPKPPVVWLPQDEIGNSPSSPNSLNDGPYAGQMIHGEVTHGGLKRVFVEKVGGEYQGTVFRFIQGLEAGVNRNVWGPDGALYVGMVGSTGNWGDVGKLHYGLQSVKYNGKPTFEMLAVRARPSGLEIEFTQPVSEGNGSDAEDFKLTRWRYQPTANYGGPKIDETDIVPYAAKWSSDRKKVLVSFTGQLPEHVYYFRLPNSWTDTDGRKLWSTESWSTVNRWPQVGR
ncbi:PA14 domain-containing protein [Neolewinella persica]|uniref:PA14 domain-containing protein n=1 Tax=Neolewinella persica TaxID=70998 RepID=UPI0012F913ED|nr:PA14 domain-containing protein [Neolewinella persica]